MRDHRSGRCIGLFPSLALGLLLSLCGGAFAETPHNSFTTDALKGDTRFLSDVAGIALTTNDLKKLADFNSMVADALKTSRGRELMRYVASCALDPSQKVTYTSGGAVDEWPGEVGLCSDRDVDVGDWSARKASKPCQELVTACVLARINAFGRKVPISLRDTVEGSIFLPLNPSVMVEQEYRDRGGIPIGSFKACPNSGDMTTNANCGWKGHRVGTCAPNEPITVQLSDSYQSVHVRICKGIYGCNNTTLDSEPGLCSGEDYVQGMIPGAEALSTSISFICPLNGYFGVMYKCASKSCSQKFDLNVKVFDSAGRRVPYPALEQDVFKYPEGAFYGNFFTKDINLCAIVTPNQVNSCASTIWNNSGPAYLNQRICAGEQCFNHAPSSCSNTCSDAFNVPSTSDSLLCKGTRALMVYLNDPRDLSLTEAALKTRFPAESQAGADLVVVSLTHEPASPRADQPVTCMAVVKNIGSGPAGASTLEFGIGGETYRPRFPVPALAPGATYAVTRETPPFIIPRLYGSVATADVLGQVVETDEANNVTTDLYQVQ